MGRVRVALGALQDAAADARRRRGAELRGDRRRARHAGRIRRADAHALPRPLATTRAARGVKVMTMDADHEKLLDELRSLVNRVDPVPEEVTKFADAALGWRRVDAELAELLSDTALESQAAAAAVRSGPRVRSLTFASRGLE